MECPFPGAPHTSGVNSHIFAASVSHLYTVYLVFFFKCTHSLFNTFIFKGIFFCVLSVNGKPVCLP